MKIIRSLKKMSDFSKKTGRRGKTIGFVPTMGALHAGHTSLIRRAREESDIVVVSIFVNPIQFGPREDYQRYPRNLKADGRLCRREGVDVLFYPDHRRMYPDNYRTYVAVRELSDYLCGEFRPGHFQGVATVVTKLFNLVSPDIAYFGQKDAQQALIIKKMAEDLNMPVKIKVVPTVREKDGLAISSRNAYLRKDERKDAAVLYQALALARKLVREGKRDSPEIIRRMRNLILKKTKASIQYIAVVNSEDLRPVDKIKDRALVALAAYIGKTRMIDNIYV